MGSNVTITYSISSGGGAAIRTNNSSKIILDKVSVYADDEITFTHTSWEVRILRKCLYLIWRKVVPVIMYLWI